MKSTEELALKLSVTDAAGRKRDVELCVEREDGRGWTQRRVVLWTEDHAAWNALLRLLAQLGCRRALEAGPCYVEREPKAAGRMSRGAAREPRGDESFVSGFNESQRA